MDIINGTFNNWQRDKELMGHKYYQKWEAKVLTKTIQSEDGNQRRVIHSVEKTGNKALETVLLDPALIEKLNIMQAGTGFYYFESDGPTSEEISSGLLKNKQTM